MYLIPQPKSVTKKDGIFYLNYRSRIVIDPLIVENAMTYASMLKQCVQQWAGIAPAVVRGKAAEGDLVLTCDPSLGGQAYKLTVSERGITMLGGDGAGVLYAVQTLCQMIEQQGAAIECVEITDAPELLHRGYYLDQTRGRVLKLDQLKQMVDKLCRYKMNEFQLYVEHTYLFSGMSEMWRDETPLTAEDILALDRYCRERHVELIPSMASFGHLYTLLSTRTYGELCELEHSDEQPFSFWDRMGHHTLNVTDDRALQLIEGMMEEYMALFTSDRFNLCADETFDLGKGRAKHAADEKGVHRIYIDFVRKLCEFLVAKGKKPMFWGDVICGQPELIRELPEETICLTWGYAPDQSEDEIRKMAQAGGKQYPCPSVIGWNRWINWFSGAYQNIVRMCDYAAKYEAVGILNTDWGDYGHVNLPEYSVPGMIYGAAFSWNRQPIPFEEINRMIAKVEYHDNSGRFVGLLAEVAELVKFGWDAAVLYYETQTLGGSGIQMPDLGPLADRAAVEADNAALLDLAGRLRQTVACMDSSRRQILSEIDVTIDGMRIWNDIGVFLVQEHAESEEPTDYALAERLETWFMAYKELWRKTSREGDLRHIADIVFWYADKLRARHKSPERI